MRYEAQGWTKFAEIDNWKNGCDPASTIGAEGDEIFSGATLEDAVKACADFVDVDPAGEDVLRDSCEEIGRLDIQRYENDNGDKATREEIARWKRGKVTLWLACYTFRIQAVERTAVSLERPTLVNLGG